MRCSLCMSYRLVQLAETHHHVDSLTNRSGRIRLRDSCLSRESLFTQQAVQRTTCKATKHAPTMRLCTHTKFLPQMDHARDLQLCLLFG